MHCPKCGAENTVEVKRGFRAQPIGSFSLAGNQMKVSAVEIAIATCTNCDLRLEGHLETGSDPEEDGLYFVADEPLK
jgi:transcription elongation factor Elf1